MPGTENDHTTSAPRTWAPSEPHLFVVLEGEHIAGGGVRCALRDVDEVLIGRGDARDVSRDTSGRKVSIALADRKISVRHARVFRDARGREGGEREGSGWLVEDLGSTNGTFVDSVRVVRAPLDDGAIIVVGRAVLRFRLALPTPPESAPIATGHDAPPGLRTLLPALAAEHATLSRVAPSKVPVLLLGATGTGKEVAARALHEGSRRAGPFVAVNCAALPDALVESQLFGHVKGAFSGAARDEPGFVRGANGGTLFLDEIGDLPRAAQGVMLRVLQESEVVPVGSSRALKVDVRIIAATHQPIDVMIARGDFRRDLFARLEGFSHRLWPLRDRREDIGLLARDALTKIEGGAGLHIAADAAAALVRHAWPLNVRELVQLLARGVTLARDGVLTLEHLPPVFGAAQPKTADMSDEDVALRATLIDRLKEHDGNVTAVAREMQKAPMQIYRWMRRLGIDPKSHR